MYAFYRGYSLRSSCLNCTEFKQNRQGDLTLGDCWHVGKFNKSMDDNGGTSLVLINTEKGDTFFQKAIESSSVDVKSFPYEMAKKNNSALIMPAIVDRNKRADFELKLASGDNSFWSDLIPLNDRIHNTIVYFVKSVLCHLHIPI